MKNAKNLILIFSMLLFSIGAFSQVTFPNIDQFERSPNPFMMILTDANGVQTYHSLQTIRDSVTSMDVDWLPLSGALTNTDPIYHNGRVIVGSDASVGAFPIYKLGVKGTAVIEGQSATQGALLDFQEVGGNRWSFQTLGQDFIIMPDVDGLFKIHGDGFKDIFEITTSTGNLQLHSYPSTRDDSGTTPVENVLYTDGNGNVKSASIDEINSGEWVEVVELSASGTTINTTDPLPANSGEVVITVNGIAQVKGASNDYDYATGGTQIDFNYTLTSDVVKVRYLKK